MAAPKVSPSMCPTCGASLPVPAGAEQVVCRYCNNVIHVDRRKPPPEVRPFGAGGMPSKTLYLDPEAEKAAAKAGKVVAFIIVAAMALPILIPIGIFVVPWGYKLIKGAVKPFPVACSLNEEVEVSGNYEGTGPLVSSVGHNCKLHIKNSKLKGSMLLKTDAANLELTLDNVTIETTDVLLKSGSNTKLKVHGSTLVSAVNAFETDSNLEFLELVGSTIESKTGTAIKSKYNLKLHPESSKIRGKKAAIDTDSSLDLSMKKSSEITSSDGVAIKSSSGMKLEADGGKIEGANGAIVTTSSAQIEATGLVLASTKESAIQSTSGMKLELTDGSVTAAAESAIAGDPSEITLINVKVQGADSGISAKSNMKLKASKKTRIVGTNGFGVLATSNTELTVSDAAIEGGTKAFKAGYNSKIKLGQGARIAGKKGGLESDSNLELDATGATIDGGGGPGILTTSNAKIAFKQGALKGTPALEANRKPSSLELDGTRIDGEQKIPAR